ncbi:hypothetical protein BJ508DRAFT_109907 [Ascobolus immersus RN42]|uniref:Uncharacterized protein n=1 Tax=Ascobolus immersus RN42 TaxID=1160509 RepID=A0A3N4I6L5_ASCIM|nr:hypothetical protein BJ508DRAFT_109907 [Ascobolus immersus RN42]
MLFTTLRSLDVFCIIVLLVSSVCMHACYLYLRWVVCRFGNVGCVLVGGCLIYSGFVALSCIAFSLYYCLSLFGLLYHWGIIYAFVSCCPVLFAGGGAGVMDSSRSVGSGRF